MDLSIIIVNYNTKEFLKGCLKSIYETAKNIKFEICVVDNASDDDSAQMVESNFPDVKLIKNKENFGFAKANNQGIETSTGRYILLLNPDVIVYPGAIEKMVEFMDKNHEAGAIGAKLLNPDGSVQISGYYCKFPSVSQVLFFYTALRHISFKIPLLKHRFWHHLDTEKPCEVDQPPGACLMIRGSVIEQVGLLDEVFFLFFNDVDLCYRIKKAGWKIFYYPEAQMLHFGGRSFTSEDIEDKINWSLYSRRGLEDFFKKHQQPIRAKVTKLIIIGDLVIKIPVWGAASFFIKSKREKAKKVLKHHWVVIESWFFGKRNKNERIKS